MERLKIKIWQKDMLCKYLLREDWCINASIRQKLVFKAKGINV